MRLTSQPIIGGMGGFVGVDLNNLPMYFALMDIPKGEWIFYLDKISLLSSIAVRHWNKGNDGK